MKPLDSLVRMINTFFSTCFFLSFLKVRNIWLHPTWVLFLNELSYNVCCSLDECVVEIFFCPVGMGCYAMSCTPLQRNILLLNVLSCWWVKKSWLGCNLRWKFCFCSTLDLSYRSRYNLNYIPWYQVAALIFAK